MISTANTKLSLSFRNKIFQQALLIIFIIIWTVLAISPVNRTIWWFEHPFVLLSAAFLVFTYKKFQLSDLSYLLITIFLILHIIGAHYCYANVPIGLIIEEFFSLTRNPYDRIVHFLFGFLITYPIYEILKRYSVQKGFWLYLLPITFIISLGAIYEIIEAVVVWTFPPELYNPFVGLLQGDIWDSYKDMLLSTIGLISCTFIIWLSNNFKKTK